MRVLIVDDNSLWCETVASFLEERDGLEVETAGTLAEARKHLVEPPPSVVILDQKLPDGEGLELAEEMADAKLDSRILIITGHPHLDDAVHALRLRIDDYLSKPVNLEVVRHAVLRIRESLRLERLDALQRRRAESDRALVRLVGEAMADTRAMIERLGPAACPVLITGPTGCGKSLVAKAVHYSADTDRSHGTERPFVKINCAAIPEGLVEAELFGVEKGAFTGAATSRPGLFELAHGGTLFLDEIGELPIQVQAKLLGVIEDGEARRVGGSRPRSFDVRVVAATHVDLRRAIEEKRFRSDLFFRLDVGTVRVPGLAERLGDLPELVEVLLERLGARDARLADGEFEALNGYGWPGNVRELRNLLERALLLQDRSALAPSELLPRVGRSTETQAPVGSATSLAELERGHILETLERFGGNRTLTANALGIGVSTLRRKLKTLSSV